jgi:hypothetical protein
MLPNRRVYPRRERLANWVLFLALLALGAVIDWDLWKGVMK